MRTPDSSPASALLERIIATGGSLIVLRGGEAATLEQQLRQHARHSGQALYLWRDGTGLLSLRDGELPVPGCRRFADALRYVAQSAHFGVYFFAGCPQPLDAGLAPLLRQLARLPGERIRRVVLMDPRALPPGLDTVELAWTAGVSARPRLRDGRWLR